MIVVNTNGLVTFFYNESRELYNHELQDEWKFAIGGEADSSFEVSNECSEYWNQRQSWQQVII